MKRRGVTWPLRGDGNSHSDVTYGPTKREIMDDNLQESTEISISDIINSLKNMM